MECEPVAPVSTHSYVDANYHSNCIIICLLLLVFRSFILGDVCVFNTRIQRTITRYIYTL